MCTVCLTAQFRVFAGMSSNFEVALRYCGVSVLFCIVFGGYVLSVDKMIQDVPWVGWIAVSTILSLNPRCIVLLTLSSTQLQLYTHTKLSWPPNSTT